MAGFHLFYGLIIFHCIYIPHFLYPVISWWTLKVFSTSWLLWITLSGEMDLWQHPTQLGKPSSHSYPFIFPHGKNHGQRGFSWYWAVLLWAISDMGKVKLFLLHCLVHPDILFYFAPVICWNFSAGLLDFHKGSLIREWFCKTVFSRSAHTMARRHWNKFVDHCRVHSQNWGLYACCSVHGWVRIPMALLACGAGYHSSH